MVVSQWAAQAVADCDWFFVDGTKWHQLALQRQLTSLFSMRAFPRKFLTSNGLNYGNRTVCVR